jgi:hypothetical protein
MQSPSAKYDEGERKDGKHETIHAAHADIQRSAGARWRRNALPELPLQKPCEPKAREQYGKLPQDTDFLDISDQIAYQVLKFFIGLHAYAGTEGVLNKTAA